MNSSLTPQQILSFYQQAEKLKTTLRHSWLSDGVRQESVAEHTWMMSLLALLILPHIKQPLNQTKVLKLIIIHDLGEAVTQDMPVWEGVQDKAGKFAAEKKAMEELLSHLDEQTRTELMELWQEYEERKTPEAQFVKVIDTLDVVTQHNATDLKTWDDNDFLWQLSPLQDAFFNFDEYLRHVKNELDKWSIEKVKAAGKLDKMDQVELKKRLA